MILGLSSARERTLSLDLMKVLFVMGEGEGEVRRIRLIVGDVSEDLFFWGVTGLSKRGWKFISLTMAKADQNQYKYLWINTNLIFFEYYWTCTDYVESSIYCNLCNSFYKVGLIGINDKSNWEDLKINNSNEWWYPFASSNILFKFTNKNIPRGKIVLEGTGCSDPLCYFCSTSNPCQKHFRKGLL